MSFSKKTRVFKEISSLRKFWGRLQNARGMHLLYSNEASFRAALSTKLSEIMEMIYIDTCC